MSEYWAVTILNGATEIDITSAPVTFGATTIVLQPLGSDEPQAPPREPLMYAPVELFHIDDSVVIRTSEQRPHPHIEGATVSVPTDHREIFHATVRFDWGGVIRITGFEERPDGALVVAVWLAEPHLGEEA